MMEEKEGMEKEKEKERQRDRQKNRQTALPDIYWPSFWIRNSLMLCEKEGR